MKRALILIVAFLILVVVGEIALKVASDTEDRREARDLLACENRPAETTGPPYSSCEVSWNVVKYNITQFRIINIILALIFSFLLLFLSKYMHRPKLSTNQ